MRVPRANCTQFLQFVSMIPECNGLRPHADLSRRERRVHIRQMWVWSDGMLLNFKGPADQVKCGPHFTFGVPRR